MATIMRAQFAITDSFYVAGGGVYTSYWRPGTSGGSAADATDILARVRAVLDAAKSATVTAVTYVPQVAVDALEDSTGALTGSFSGTAPASVSGTGGSEGLPPGTSLLVTAHTGQVVNGRQLRGRHFLPGFNEAAIAAGLPNQPTFPGLAAAYTASLTGGSTASFPVVWHRPQGGSGGSSFAVTSYALDLQKWGQLTSRRR